MRAALDTNVLVYAEGLDDLDRQARILRMLGDAPDGTLVLPVQVVGELVNVLIRKGGFEPAEARRIAYLWIGRTLSAPTEPSTIALAMDLIVDHHFSIWDAVIIAAAAEAGCDLLLSEDMHPGFRWRGVTIVNPFAEPMSPLLDTFLDQSVERGRD